MTTQPPAPITIRDFTPGEEEALWTVFHDAVHALTTAEYSAEQRAAWAPETHDVKGWAQRIRGNRPFVAMSADQVAGFADVRASGYIDHFFVARDFKGQGVANALMQRIHVSARAQGVATLSSDVSLSAQPFFLKNGFVVVRRQQVERNGVVLENARMEKRLAEG